MVDVRSARTGPQLRSQQNIEQYSVGLHVVIRGKGHRTRTGPSGVIMGFSRWVRGGPSGLVTALGRWIREGPSGVAKALGQ
jgi:hypothetical protein